MRIISRGLVAQRGLCLLDVDLIAPSGALPRSSMALRALVDTGAEGSLLVARLAAGLGLPVEGVAEVVDPFGKITPCFATAADVVFRDDRTGSRNRVYTISARVIVVDAEFKGGYELILGADVLREFDLRVNYPEGWLSLSLA